MRKTKRSGNFLLCLLFNMLLNIDGALPFMILLALHFIFDISIWWSIVAIAIWLGWLIVWMLFIGFAGRCGNTPDPPKENKNPYSKRNNKF